MRGIQEIKRILKEHKEELKNNYGITEIGVFGSYARKEQTKKSDIDILVEFDQVPDLLKFIELERKLQRYLGRRIDLVRKKTIRQELKKGILSEAITVWRGATGYL